VIRRPRIHGFPPRLAGSIVMRSAYFTMTRVAQTP
jgi:hypothetical protein